MHSKALNLVALNVVMGILLGCPSFVWANEFVRPLDPGEYFEDINDQTLVEHAQRVQGVRVAWVNFEALRRDFPALANLDEQHIKDWLIQNFAYIGSLQHRLNGLRNSTIPIITGDTRIAIRPTGWMRSAAMEALAPDGSPIGMVDIKGIGHGVRSNIISRFEHHINQFHLFNGQPELLDSLRIADHSDGLMSLGEAIAEVTRQQAAQLLFNESGLRLETVESYAILALPFDILKDRGQQIPAALYLRQANLGRSQNLEVPESILIDNHGNRQHTRMRTLVDFGGVILQDSRIEAQFGPFDQSNAQATRPWIWGHETAIAFAKRGDHEAVKRHIEEMLAPLKNDANIQAAQQRHRLIEQELLTLIHQNRHLSYSERRTVFIEARTEATPSSVSSVITIDHARNVLLKVSTPYLSQEGHDAIQSIISQNSIYAFEAFKEVFLRSSHPSMIAILQNLIAFSESPFYTAFSQELFDLLSEAYLARSVYAYYSHVKIEAIKVILSLQRHLIHSDKAALLTRIELLLESVSNRHELDEILKAFKGQSTRLATQMLLKGLQSSLHDRDVAMSLAPYNTDPQVIQWIEQNFKTHEALPLALIKAIKEARNPQYRGLFQKRLQQLISMPSVKASQIEDTLTVLSLMPESQGTKSSEAILEAMPRLSPIELFEVLISFRGDATLELIYAVREQIQTLRRPIIEYILKRGLSHLLRQQNHLEALGLIQDLMQSPDQITAEQAVMALARYTDPQSAQILSQKLFSPSDRLARTAVQALLERTDTHARITLESAFSHTNLEIRAFTARAQAVHYSQYISSRCSRLLAD